MTTESEAKKTTLVGIAQDAKAGAVIVRGGDEEPVYLQGLDAWPADVRGKHVRATGTLRRIKKIPDPGTDPITAGAFGDQLILESPTWSVTAGYRY